MTDKGGYHSRNSTEGEMNKQGNEPAINLPAAPNRILPVLVRSAGTAGERAWTDFFDGKLANAATRRAYEIAVRQFLTWCEQKQLQLNEVMAGDVGLYFREHAGCLATKKQHISAIRRFFNLLVERHICLLNPALSAETERYEVVEGKTPEITAKQIRSLLASIDTRTLIGMRDKTAICIMIFTACRAGAVAKLRYGDYRGEPGSRRLRFREKGGKSREIAVRHDLEQMIDSYVFTTGLCDAPKDAPLFCPASATQKGDGTAGKPMQPNDMCRMVKRRLRRAELPVELSAHSFRVATITNLIGQQIPIEDVQQLAGHKDARTTKLYDRTQRKVTRNLVERISFSSG